MFSLIPFLERPKKRKTIPLDGNPLPNRYVLCFGVIYTALVRALERSVISTAWDGTHWR